MMARSANSSGARSVPLPTGTVPDHHRAHRTGSRSVRVEFAPPVPVGDCEEGLSRRSALPETGLSIISPKGLIHSSHRIGL